MHLMILFTKFAKKLSIFALLAVIPNFSMELQTQQKFSRKQKIIASACVVTALCGLGAYIYFKTLPPSLKVPASFAPKVPPFLSNVTSTVLDNGATITDFNYDRDMPFINPLLKQEWPNLYGHRLASTDDYDLIHSCFRDRNHTGRAVGIKVAQKNNETIGFITYFLYSKLKGHIDLLAVAVHERKQGLATALINHVEIKMARAGVQKIDIVVHETNTNALNLYKQLGYLQTPISSVWQRLKKYL